jgi:hypothetical protein
MQLHHTGHQLQTSRTRLIDLPQPFQADKWNTPVCSATKP